MAQKPFIRITSKVFRVKIFWIRRKSALHVKHVYFSIWINIKKNVFFLSFFFSCYGLLFLSAGYDRWKRHLHATNIDFYCEKQRIIIQIKTKLNEEKQTRISRAQSKIAAFNGFWLNGINRNERKRYWRVCDAFNLQALLKS